jgi:pimeloyl-ACP methyl ester carboxylesterase
MRSPVWRGIGQAPGEGRPVILVPGFMAGDGSLAIMTRWLRSLGYHTHRAGIRTHVDCSAKVAKGLEEVAERMADKTGQRVSIVGQSRGGMAARALAVHRPDLIGGIVTLGSPTVGMFHVHPVVLGSIGMVGALHALRVPGTLGLGCLLGSCCKEFRRDLECQDWPSDVAYTGVYSKHDGIVSWKACLDPCADEHLEVSSSHCGMAVHPDVFGIVGRSLARFGTADDVPVWTEWAKAA